MTSYREPYHYAMGAGPDSDPHLVNQALHEIPGRVPISLLMKQAGRYTQPSVCIYCRKREGKTDEHIVPLMLGGRLVFGNASCTICQGIINDVETYCCENNFQFGRTHFGVRGRKAKGIQMRTRISHAATIRAPFIKDSLPIEEHPGALVMTIYQRGMQLLRSEEAHDIEHNATIIQVGKKFSSPIYAVKGVFKLGGTHPIIFGRLLAKIAHGFATAELGLDSFRPILNDYILGVDLRHPAYWIETDMDDLDPEDTLHSLSIAPHALDPEEKWVIVRVRLFSSVASPIYRVIVGERSAI